MPAETPPPIRSGLPRGLDLMTALVALAVSTPLLALLALGVKVSSPGPVLFRQQRMGRGGRPFALIKLRTMHAGAGGSSITAGADPRVTGFGRFLRASKLDELPQFWNVVRGDMALVGPRPEVAALVDTADPRWRRVLEARPGLTDPLTVRLRNEQALLGAAPDPDAFYRTVLQPYKLAGYLEYLARRSAWSDLGVLVDTVVAIVAPGRAQAPSLDDLRRSSQGDASR